MAIARTSLANIEDKLRRLLGLVANVDASFNAETRPVVVVDDLTRVGNSISRGRHFARGVTGGALAINSSFGVKALAPLVITDLYMFAQNVALTTWTYKFLSAGDADPYAMTTVATIWTENMQNDTDLAPIGFGSGGTAGGVTIQAEGIITSGVIHLRQPVHLPTGAKLCINNDTATTSSIFGWAGYTY